MIAFAFVLCNFQSTRNGNKTEGNNLKSCEQVSWWPIVRKPPVPIPNTVVKTYRGENTWRATAWEDSTLPRSNLNKEGITWTCSSFFLLITFTILCFAMQNMGNHPPSHKTILNRFVRQSHPEHGRKDLQRRPLGCSRWTCLRILPSHFQCLAKMLRTSLAIRNTWRATAWEDSTLPTSKFQRP